MSTIVGDPRFQTAEILDFKTEKRRVAEMVNKGIAPQEIFQELNADSEDERGEMFQVVLNDGGMRSIRWKGRKRVREMITTAQGAMDLLEKVRVDVAFGQADVPLLYGPLYERVDGPFPGGVVQIDENTLQANVVFLEKLEAGEVRFGTLKRGAPSQTPIQTYAAGFEYTEDMIEYDRTFQIDMLNRAFGRAWNFLKNHVYLGPFIATSFTGGNATAADATAGASLQEKTLRTFQTAFKATVQARPQRTFSWLLASEVDRFQIEEALLQPVRDAQGNALPRVPIEGIIYYDGATVENGVKSYVYPGVTAGTVYCIMPRLKMKEFVHHDLRVDIGPPDISRLIEGQQVGRGRIGLYADLLNSAQKVTLPV